MSVLEGLMKIGQKIIESKKGKGKAPTVAAMQSTVDKWSAGPKSYLIVKSMRQARQAWEQLSQQENQWSNDVHAYDMVKRVHMPCMC